MLHCLWEDPAFVPELDLVMERDGELIGQVIYLRAEIACDDGRKLPVMTFGPIGIAPQYQHRGYGKRLLDFSLERAKALGAGALIISAILTAVYLFTIVVPAYFMPLGESSAALAQRSSASRV